MLFQIARRSGCSLPADPATGTKEPKCALAVHNNCGGGISRDHIVSEAVLAEISDARIEIVGADFRRDVKKGSDSLQTKCLCERHNGAMSPLDTQAQRFARVLRRHQATLTNPANVERDLKLFQGFDVERWLVKTLIGTYRAQWSIKKSQAALPDHVTDLFHLELEPPQGLYVSRQPVPLKSRGYPGKRPPLSVALLHERATVTGVDLSLGPVQLRMLIAGSADTIKKTLLTHAYRPQALEFVHNESAHMAMMRWRAGTDEILEFHVGTPPQGVAGPNALRNRRKQIRRARRME